MKELTKAGLLDTSLPTVTGKTVGENLETAENLDTSLIRPLEEPYSKTRRHRRLFGNLAPDGCVVKQSAVAPKCCGTRAPPGCSTARRRPSPSSTPGASVPATWW